MSDVRHETQNNQFWFCECQQNQSIWEVGNEEFTSYEWLDRVKFDDSMDLDTDLIVDENDESMLYPPELGNQLRGMFFFSFVHTKNEWVRCFDVAQKLLLKYVNDLFLYTSNGRVLSRQG